MQFSVAVLSVAKLGSSVIRKFLAPNGRLCYRVERSLALHLKFLYLLRDALPSSCHLGLVAIFAVLSPLKSLALSDFTLPILIPLCFPSRYFLRCAEQVSVCPSVMSIL